MHTFVKLLFFWRIGVNIVLALSDGPDISGDYKIISVTDDTYLSGNFFTNITTAEHENNKLPQTQIWKLQQANDTSYKITIKNKKFENISLIAEANGLQQKWHLEPVGHNLWILFANGTDMKCLTNNGEGQPVNLSSGKCGNTTSQLWSLFNLDSSQVQDYSGVYYIQSQDNGQFLAGSTNTSERLLVNRNDEILRKNPKTMALEWKIDRRYEYGHCYEIRLFKHHNQIIPLGNESNVVERLPLVWAFELVGQARWKIKQLNTDHCLSFFPRLHTGQMEVKSKPCEKGGFRQVWFLIRISNPDSKNGHRKCVALNSSPQLRIENQRINYAIVTLILAYFFC